MENERNWEKSWQKKWISVYLSLDDFKDLKYIKEQSGQVSLNKTWLMLIRSAKKHFQELEKQKQVQVEVTQSVVKEDL